MSRTQQACTIVGHWASALQPTDTLQLPEILRNPLLSPVQDSNLQQGALHPMLDTMEMLLGIKS